MSILTNKIGNHYLHQQWIDETDFKLGELEDIEEEIGCPIEVVFKALKNGIYLEESKSITTSIYYHILENEFVIEWYKSKEDYGYELLKDYKKTWWLREDKTE